MSSFRLNNQGPLLGAGTFWSRQLSTVSDSLPGFISDTLRSKRRTASIPAMPENTSLPQVETKPVRWPLYAGLGVGALVLVAILKKR